MVMFNPAAYLTDRLIFTYELSLTFDQQCSFDLKPVLTLVEQIIWKTKGNLQWSELFELTNGLC